MFMTDSQHELIYFRLLINFERSALLLVPAVKLTPSTIEEVPFLKLSRYREIEGRVKHFIGELFW